MPPIRQPSPGPTSMHATTQNPKATNNCIPAPVNQSSPASISPISPQSRSDLGTDHGDMIDETIKHVTQTIEQTLLTSNVSNTSTNRICNDPPHENTPDLMLPAVL